jgi:hypothetical protein
LTHWCCLEMEAHTKLRLNCCCNANPVQKLSRNGSSLEIASKLF